MSPIDLTTIQDSICKSWQHCSIFYFVKHLPERLYINCTHQEIKHCVTLSYTNSVLNFKTVKVKSNDKVTKTVISILLGGLLESGHTISSIDLFNCGLEDSVCSLLCKSIFNDKFKLDCIEELDLSSNRTTEYFIDSIIESFRYCIIKKLIVSFSNFTVLDGFAKDLFTAYSTQKRLLNVIHGVPFSVINHREVNEPTPFSESVINFEEDEEDLYSCFDNDIGDQTWESHIITFFVNCRIDSDTIKKGVLCDLQTDLKFTKLYKFHIYDSFKKSSNPLEELVSILSLQIVNNLVIHEVNLPDRLVRETLNILIQLGGGICYVLTSKTMIHAYNASIYQILAAVQQISFINSMQPVLIEQPVYMNNASPTNISCHWQCIDLNNCNITDEELYKLHTYFCNDTIRLLNLSNNNLSLPAIFSFILNCRFVQNLHFDGRYSEFHLCETLFGLFPSSIFTRDLQIEVRFKKSTAFILCGSQLCESHSCIDDFLATAIASSESIHFLMINCSFHMQDNNFIHVLHGFSLASNLSSLHIHNASLQFHHLLSVIEILLHVKLFIVEKDFVFTNNNYSENYHNHVKNFFSGECARVEITWHSAYEGVTAFIFKEMTLFKDAMKMTSILKGTASIHRFSISNVYVNDDLAEDVAMLISMDTLSVVKLANLSLSGQQMMLIHKSLEFSTSLIHLEINHTNAVNYYQDELFSIVAKKQNTNFLIIEKELVFTNYSHTKSFFAQKGIRFEVQPVHFTVSIIREMATINYAIKMKTLLKETKTLSSFSILNACMTDDQAEDVALLLSTESDNLTKVELMKLNLSGKQLMIILTSLQDTNSLSHLVINSINVVNHCQDELFSIIAGNENLSHLEISNCNLKEATVIKITEAIFIISESLRCLILSCNNISDIAAAKLATTLRKTNFLIHLDLSSTNLQAQGITSIAQSLRQNTWLYSFCISNCNLPKQTVEDIVSCVLDDSKSLSCLEMSNCKLEETLILDITTALTKISSLHTLDLSLNKITDIAAANLAAVITWNQNIECLRLSMNGLNETSVFNVLTSCKVLSKLTCVDLDFAHVSAPVSEGSSNIYLSIDDIIEGVAINNNDCDGTYEYITLMNDIRQLTHLTLSNCSYMEMFSALVALSSLEHLDVNSSKIPFTAISTTIENNTSLKHINISNCSLQDHMFHEIAKAMSTLTELRHLNISGIRIANKAAGFVAATITRNPAIYHLDLSKCQLQSNGLMKIVKQLINLRQLSYLDVSYNYFTAEAANELASTFTRSFELEHLCLSHCNLCEQSFLSIVKSLASMNAIRHLNLSSNIINSETTIVLSGCIANNSNLEYLDLSNCYSTVSENYIEKVTSSLKLLSSIKHLNISSTNLNDSAVDDLAFAINNNTGLECINFSNCKVQGNGMLKILQKLLQAYTLKCINLQGSTIHTKQVNTRSSKNLVTILVRIITNNKSLEHINMSNCELSTLEVKSIMKAHSVLSNLIHIKISQNSVNTKAADEIASVITNNKSLEVLDFSCCDMGGDSMTTVVDTLAQCMHLRVVNLSNNIITEETTTKLALSLCNNATLEHLDVSCCSLECSQFFATLSTSAQFYFKLKHLNLSSNKITYRASCDLHSFLAVSGMTEHLDLSDCSLTENDDEDGLYIVLSALQNSNSLKHLNLQSNKFTEKAACALYNVVCVNQNLDFLNLNQCDVPEFLLGDILKQCRLLTLLDIGHNVVTDETAYLLSCAVSNGILKYLNIEDCILQEDGTEILVDAMTYGTNMEYIVAEEYMEHTTTGAVISDISILIFKFGISSYNPLAGKIDSVVVKPVYYFKLTSDCLLEDMIDIIESVFDMESIEYFNVSCCDLRDHNFYLILQAMKNSSTLKYLQLKSSSIPDEGLSSIVSAISSSTIVHTDFSDCNLLESQVSLVVKGLVTLSNLKYLNVSDNKISIEATNDIAEVITNNKSLQYLSLNNCGIGDAGIQIICNALSNITSLLSLDISNNCIGNNSAVRIANVLYSNNELQHLNLTNCFAECFFTISHVDSQMQAIKNLSLENNQIDDHAAEIIKYVFICNSTVEYLNLSHCNMTETGLLSILSALETVKSLQFLNLTSNNFTKSVLRKLLSVIQTNINIKKLVFSNCKLPQKDLITYINLALSDTSLVQYIDFSCNSCDAAEQDHETSDLCVEHIVTVNESLEYFNLSHCNLSDVIMHEIVLVLQKCTSLTTLRLCSSTISSGSLLGSVITNNQSLEYLDLSNCKLQQEDIKTIADGLKKTNSCRFLLLNSNTINDTAAKVLASTISTSLSLTLNQLSLSNCKLDDKGILYIADALQWISSLQHLDLSYNAITDDAAAKISTGLSCNTALEYLNMSYCTWSSNGLKIIHKQLDLENFTNLREVDFSNDG
ncbi:uncharacterized protein [Dysidea avara]|uniref:uncharacterized protein n=1 Tax=Dysidea avara TaxID=196820 RepID=UPI003324418A